MASTQRGKFSNRIGFLAAAAGSAVGLGNIWKFPYETGANGGAAFLIIYLFCAFVIAMPIMVAEISMGRNSNLNPVGAFKKLGGKRWGLVGLIGIIAGIMILSFYNVVAGWAFGYFVQITFGDLLSQASFGSYFENYIADVDDNLIYSFVFMVFTAVIVAGGVQKGIERSTKILMPALVIIIVGLIIYSLTLPNAMKGIEFYLIPDFTKVTGGTFYKALSQAFFSLSLGMGALITYGSYFSKKDNIVSSAALVTAADITIAFLAGLLIFPLVFSQGLTPTAGPGLVFVALPGVFESMGPIMGKIFGGSFFLLLCFAALTSTISLLEVPVSYITDEFKKPRKATVAILAIIIFIVGLPSLFSNGAVKELTEFVHYGGETKSFMDLVIDVFSDLALPVGGFLTAIFVSYKWKTRNLANEIENGHSNFRGSIEEKFVNVMLGVISPLVVGFIIIVTVLEKFFDYSVFG